MADLGRVIARHAEPLTITRHAEGSYVNGRYQQNVPFQEISIQGSVQPMDFKTLQLLPEGERTRAKYQLWTTTKLQIIADPDHMVYQNIEYELQGIENWSFPGNYYRYLLMKIAGQPLE